MKGERAGKTAKKAHKTTKIVNRNAKILAKEKRVCYTYKERINQQKRSRGVANAHEKGVVFRPLLRSTIRRAFGGRKINGIFLGKREQEGDRREYL